ncbi:4-hydroxybenzoyl-CoA thioesterase family active site [hydrothermal vent metagenome]|uniref:4-hydroxybenzoyl-CoA thioesterase family active site n=1 Tax=hydrothermal vent metagenome TaxID=652676 RepID=A0A1W1CIN0_9ZZZZ
MDFPIRIYYEDTDAGGVVYYANYLKFIERARTEYLTQCGLEQDIIREENNIVFVVRKVTAEYIKPAKFNDRLLVQTKITNISKVSIIFTQKILDKITNKVLFSSLVEVVSVDFLSFKIKRIPKPILEKIK